MIVKLCFDGRYNVLTTGLAGVVTASGSVRDACDRIEGVIKLRLGEDVIIDCSECGDWEMDSSSARVIELSVSSREDAEADRNVIRLSARKAG